MGPAGDIGFQPVANDADIGGGGNHRAKDDFALMGLEGGSGDFLKSFKNAAKRGKDTDVGEHEAQIIRAGAAHAVIVATQDRFQHMQQRIYSQSEESAAERAAMSTCPCASSGMVTTSAHDSRHGSKLEWCS